MSESILAPEEVLDAIGQLSATDLDWLVPRVVALRLTRKGIALPQEEALLLEQIAQSIPSQIQQRYHSLIALREAGTLTAEQHIELITLTQAYERFALIRLKLIARLAELRQSTPAILVNQLGLALSPHV